MADYCLFRGGSRDGEMISVLPGCNEKWLSNDIRQTIEVYTYDDETGNFVYTRDVKKLIPGEPPLGDYTLCINGERHG